MVLLPSVIVLLLVLLLVSKIDWQALEPAQEASPAIAPPADVVTETLAEGEGEGAATGDVLRVHYTGTLVDGTKFDSSLDRGVPFEVTLGTGAVIEGWERGLLGMKKGEKRRLTIPPELGYGDRQAGDIPPNSTLVFEVELLEINP
ncbi:FKBP-type peptidyl-prolyl cis-trans isomerase [Candidatus Uhrbacteria bacterium]|nr:FKBP-type peptidyl-prolyl cis-trans isomerase [Candidatus Uhrbacteria bacterium]